MENQNYSVGVYNSEGYPLNRDTIAGDRHTRAPAIGNFGRRERKNKEAGMRELGRWRIVRFVVVAASILLTVLAIFGYRAWENRARPNSEELLALMPAEAQAVIFIHMESLRQAPFFADLLAWAPKPTVDADYAEFVRETGFEYERDLRSVAIAVWQQGAEPTFFAVADGRFDRKKIETYALRGGIKEKNGRLEIFHLPASGGQRIWMAFLANDRVVVTNHGGAGEFLQVSANEDAGEWRKRFSRLAGSPIFAVTRQWPEGTFRYGLPGNKTPGKKKQPGEESIRAPELSALLEQLQWITVAAKPEGEQLRVVAEGECPSEGLARQLSDMLNGAAILAQAGLSDTKARQQINSKTRAEYIALLRSLQVSSMDREGIKSVRVVFEVGAKLLQTIQTSNTPSALQ